MHWNELSGPLGRLIISPTVTIKTGFVEYFYPSKLIRSTSAATGCTISLKDMGIFLA